MSFSYGQSTYEAKNIKYTIEDNKLKVSYDLPETPHSQYFEVSVQILDSSTNMILDPVTISGDYGEVVSGGNGKNFTWDFFKDTINITSIKFSVRLNVEMHKIYGGSNKALLSLACPGLGDYFVSKNKLGFLQTIAVASFIGYGIYLKSESNSNYNLYHTSYEQSAIDNYYNVANEQNKSANVFLTIGGIIWAEDIFYVFVRGSINDKLKKQLRNKMKTTSGINVNFGATILPDNYGSWVNTVHLIHSF